MTIAGQTVTITQDAACTPRPANLVAWLPADGNAKNLIGSTSATLLNGASYATGKVKQAFSLDGINDSIETSTTGLMNALSLTIECWVKPQLRSDGEDFPTNVISNNNAGQFGHGFGVNVSASGSQMKVEYQNGFAILPAVTFTAGEWYHIAVVYTSGNFKAFVNGQLVHDFNFAQEALDGANLIRIGRHNDDAGYGTKRFFKGLIDEVSLYSRALSETTI